MTKYHNDFETLTCYDVKIWLHGFDVLALRLKKGYNEMIIPLFLLQHLLSLTG
jgi:hypothetical protein